MSNLEIPSKCLKMFKQVCFIIFLAFSSMTKAQVSTIIYDENFNSGPGGWVTGGFHSSWKHGIPSLLNIISNGTPCFTTGDAGEAITEPFAACLPVNTPTTTGNFYNCCERSFAESPVIDLTGVTSPLLSLDINLYCEQTFDGAKVQLSLNSGLTWQDIGNYNSSVYLTFPNNLNCREQNWYNKNNINYLNSTAGGCGMVNYFFSGNNSGWSGGCSQAGNGSCTLNDIHGTNGWITASHCIPQAANKPAVKIRVVFGSGSQVFSDGIAFDNVKITDVYPVVNFAGSQVTDCNPVFQFANTTDCASIWNWDFGYPGAVNSSLQNPLHEFPAAGTYSVSLSATDFCGGNSTLISPIIVGAGSAPVISQVIPGATQLCDSTSGSAEINFSQQGNPPYTINFNFNNNPVSLTGITGNPVLLSGLSAGNYNSLLVTDSSGCASQQPVSFVIPFTGDGLTLTVSPDTTIMIGSTAGLSAETNIPASFAWMPQATLDNSFVQFPVATPNETTTYQVTATDTNGCIATSTVTIYVKDDEPCNRYFFPNSFTPNGDGKNDFYKAFIDPDIRLLEFEMKIYSRWGEAIFSTNKPENFWNGKSHPTGIYAVTADFKCRNKKTSRYTGIINLIK